MNQECARCARPVADVGVICHSCSTGLTVVLLRAALHSVHLDDTIARLDRISHGIGGRPQPAPVDGWTHGEFALEAQPLPINLGASRDAAAVRNTLTTWVRHVVDERGSAWPSDALTGLLCWMAGQTKWLRMRQEADEAFDELHDAARLVARTIDAPPRRALAGQCDCGAYLYAIEGREQVTCQGCGETYDVESTRRMLLIHAEGLHLSAAELAILAVHLRLSEDRQRTRKLINKWVNRGQIMVWPGDDDQVVLRVGDVMTRLVDRMVAA